jgi:3'-phosphoadenosine 5'-phosphosulfate sulfotransferase (PAPS reductase)/FAD synthetase
VKKEIFKIDNEIDVSKTLPEKIETSLDVIYKVYQKSKEQKVPLFVNFSGGKDSSAVLLLAKEIAPKNTEAIYMTTRLELPGTVEFVKQEAERLGIYLHITDPVVDYMGDFAHWVKHCNSRLKIRTARRYLRKLYGRKHMFRLNGVRQQESTRRKSMYKAKGIVVPDHDLSGSYIVYPIIEWTGDDVKEYLKLNNFETHKQYTAFGISGCAYCPFYQKEIYQRILNVYPNIYDEIIKLEGEVNRPSVQGNVYLRDLKEEFFANQDEIMKNIGEPKEKIKRCKTSC